MSFGYSFTVPNVPVGWAPYTIEAFLDDDDSGSNGGPTSGDLITLNRPSVLVEALQASEVELALDGYVD